MTDKPLTFKEIIEIIVIFIIVYLNIIVWWAVLSH